MSGFGKWNTPGASRLSSGTFTVPKCKAIFSGTVVNYFDAVAAIHEIQITAGAAIGSAVISYPLHYAKDATPEMGKSARLTLDGKTIFRGIVGHVPFQISESLDEVKLVLFDDKWMMARKTIGQYGVGTEPTTPAENIGTRGFHGVGYEIVFNKDGKPNKNPASYDFFTGSTAVFWTLKAIMYFVFHYYIDADVATVDIAALSGAWTREPSELNLAGQTALQAVDTLAQMAGESWGLIYGASASAYTSVKPGSGTARKVYLQDPQRGARANNATLYHASSISGGKSIRDARDKVQAVSDRVVIECTISTETQTIDGESVDPMLVVESTFKDAKYAVRYKVDVTKYAAHNLGENLTAGERPKPWLNHLVTRKNADGSAYLTKAELDATPAYLWNDPCKDPYVWLATDGDIANAKLVAGGMRIDCKHATIDFQRVVTLLDEAGFEVKESIESWTNVGIWLTVATVTEYVDSKESAVSGQYLPKQVYQLIVKSDLVPQYRFHSLLPKLSTTDPNDRDTVADDGVEKYVDVADWLQDAIDSALDESSAVENPLEMEFAFMPLLNIGDLIELAGRNVGASGDEVVTEISYKIYESFLVSVKATNMVGSIKPEAFVKQ